MAVLDHHVHSQYSDGSDLEAMVRAAWDADIDGIGFADHCNITSENIRNDREYFFHETYRSRREEIAALADRYPFDIYDAVEFDYYPHDECRIESFLEDVGFDYVVGSVHYINDRHVANDDYFGAKSRPERVRLVDSYVESIVRLLESDLFDIAAHLDVIERYRPFRDLVSESHYSAIADALADSRTVPEINVGRVFTDYGRTHPRSEFVDYLNAQGIEFTFGTDAHTPRSLTRGVEFYRNVLAESDATFVRVDG